MPGFQVKYNYSQHDEIDSKNNSTIHLIINNAWEGKTFHEEEMMIVQQNLKKFLKLMKQKKYRKLMLKSLNKFRINGKFILDDRSNSNLCELFNKILDEIYIHKDYESAKSCIILSQTFYKPADDINQKIFLFDTIENHQIWKNIKFWEQIIKCKSYIYLVSIREEINNQKHNFDNPDDEKKCNEYCIFGQLISFIYNMISFNVGIEIVKDLIMEFCKIHNLSDDLTKQISLNIQEYNDRKSQIKSKEIVNDNISIISSEKNIVYLTIIKEQNLVIKKIENDLKSSSNTNYKSINLIEKRVLQI